MHLVHENLADALQSAIQFAARAHLGQTLPASEQPYLLHLSLVCFEVLQVARPDLDRVLMAQCAALHDSIEDTDATYEQLRDQFGETVADGVLALSKDPTLRKEDQIADSLERIRHQGPEIWIVKMADRIVNLSSAPDNWTRSRKLKYKAASQAIHAALHTADGTMAARLARKIEQYDQFL